MRDLGIRTARLVACVLTASVVITLMWAATTSPAAEAGGPDCAGAPVFSAGTPSELNNAILCYNTASTPESYIINLTADIAGSGNFPNPAGNASFYWITQSTDGFDLTINGGGFTITGSTDADTHGLGVSSGEVLPPVVMNDLTITTATASGVRASSADLELNNVTLTMNGSRGLHASNSVIVINQSTITANTGSGILASFSDVEINDSVFSGNGGFASVDTFLTSVEINTTDIAGSENGINALGRPLYITDSIVRGATNNGIQFGGFVDALRPELNEGSLSELQQEDFLPVLIDGSTIADNGASGVQLSDGHTLITNSTITNNQVYGIDAEGFGFQGERRVGSLGGLLSVANSTVSGNTQLDIRISPDGGFNVAAGSSIVETCTTDPIVADFGANVGQCFGGPEATLMTLFDNDCATPTPSGCPRTMALAPGSAAAGAGLCIDTPIGWDTTALSPVLIVGALDVDQRDTPRTPVEAGCDAGAFEAATYELTVTKTVVGLVPEADWEFTATADDNCFTADPALIGEFTLAAAGASTTLTFFDGCEVTVTETEVDGYGVTPSSSQVATMSEDTTLTFTNTQIVNDLDLTIVKVVEGSQDVTSSFTIAPSDGCVATPTTTDIVGSGQAVVTVTDVSTSVAGACTYEVTEAAIDGYDVTPSATQSAAPGDTVTFTNTQTVGELEIMIVKTVFGAQDVTSSFTITPSADCVATPAAVDIVGTDNATIAVTDIASSDGSACTYDITEAELDGYSVAPSATQAASPGDTVTFVNTQMSECVGEAVTLWVQPGVPLVGTPGDDVILGTSGDDDIDAGEGNDLVCSLEGNDTVKGGDGDDTVWAGEGDDMVDGGEGNDKLVGQMGADTMTGGGGADTLHGNLDNDTLSGDGGNDRIYGYGGDDIIDGGEGNDFLHGNFGDDMIDGGEGDDFIFGYGDDDVLKGGDGDDTIRGNFGDDNIDGQGGNDQLFGADGQDTVRGGPGDDAVNGNFGDDVLYGGAGADLLRGLGGNDQLFGNSGADELRGGIGDDQLDGGVGDDTLDANSGEDMLSGGAGNDSLAAGPGSDIAAGGDGDDTVIGGLGDDTVSGDAGDDMLFGGPGDDSLDGGADTDTCTGGANTDTATGCETEISIP